MIDLHTHTDASDGDLTPSELIALASASNITALAVTDHDTMSGLVEAKEKAADAGIRIIPGVETEIEFEPGEFHILGLGMDLSRIDVLETFLEEIRRRRNDRNIEMVELMQSNGLSVSLEELDGIAGGEVTGRMHFAKWLIVQGLAKNVPDCFERWLGPRGPYYVPKNRPKLEETLDVIHSAGGKAVLAHPLTLWISWGRMGKYLPEWKETGLDGIEARHSGASKREAARYEELAIQNGLFITGGSDFHGMGRPDRNLGYGAAGLPLEDDLLYPFDHA